MHSSRRPTAWSHSLVRFARSAPFALFIAAGCTASSADAPPAASAESSRAEEPPPAAIRLIMPATDSVGDQPARFEWSGVPEADHYQIGLWNEVDVRVWVASGLKETSIERPPQIDLPSGTYFWMIAAYQGEQEVGNSGRSAFVVFREPR